MITLTTLLMMRYLKGAFFKSSIATILISAILGIAVATATLHLVLAIMSGFEQATIANLKGIHADIIMQTHQGGIDLKKIKQVFKKEFPEIDAFSPCHIQQILINNIRSQEMPLVALIKAIDPIAEAQTSYLEKTIIRGSPAKRLPEILNQKQRIILGYKLSQLLNVSLNDSIELLVPSFEADHTVSIEKITATIGGIIKTGIDEYDTSMVICAMSFWQSMFPDTEIQMINIATYPKTNKEKLIQRLHARTALEVYEWTELYPALLSALTLEKYTIFLVISLIVLMASMNIIAVLFMLTTYKQGDIAILQSMGLSIRKTRLLFTSIGCCIGLFSSILGLIISSCCGFILQHYFKIPLPEAYYVSHVPINITYSSTILVFGLSMVLSLAATWYATRSIKNSSLIQLLRQEA